jgi:CubicO group peptidase (beta-lactamase class C family)
MSFWLRSALLAVLLVAAVLVMSAWSAPPRAPGARDITGEWDTSWGWMVLEAGRQEGKTLPVTGYWIQNIDQKGVIESGTFDPATRTLDVVIVQSWNKQRGKATFKLAPDGRTFNGTWEHSGGKGEWVLRRVHGDTFEAKVDSLVANAGVRPDGPGGALAVVEGGEVILAKGYGLAYLRDRTPNTAHTGFELASVSKQFTAAAIMLLHDQGKLSFDDDVRKYIPELPVYDHQHPIRIHHLLHHTSGLPQYGSLEVPQVPRRRPPFICNEDFAREFARQRTRFPQQFRPGDKDDYNNGGYMLLALIAGRVSGKSFGTFLHDEIFKPLGMKHSWVYENPRVHPKDPCMGYCKGEKTRYEEYYGCPPHKNENWLCAGGSGIWSSAEDLAKWDPAWRDGKLFKPETVKRALSPWKTNKGQTVNYGFGWNLGLTGAGKVSWISHNGGGPSFCSTNYINFAEDRSIAVLSNWHEFEHIWVRDGIESLRRFMKYKEKEQ